MRDAFFYASHVCKGKLEDDDVYDLCYSALCEAAKNFRPKHGTRFMAYAKAFIRGHISRMWKTKDTVRNASMHETGEAGLEELPEQSIDPEFEQIDIRERMALVQPLINRLTEQERIIIDLHFRAGYSFCHIGKLLAPRISRSAVQQTAAHALSKLRGMAREKIVFSSVQRA